MIPAVRSPFDLFQEAYRDRSWLLLVRPVDKELRRYVRWARAWKREAARQWRDNLRSLP